MKILIVSPPFLKSDSVATVRMDSLVDFLMKKNNYITIVTDKVDYKREFSSNKHVNIVEITHTNTSQYRIMVKEILSKEQFDIMLITLGPYYTLPIVQDIKKEFNIKIILDYRDLWTFDFRGKWEFINIFRLLKRILSYFIEKKAMNSSDLVVTVTKRWQNKIIRYFFLEKDKVKLVSNGYDERFYLEINNLNLQKSKSKLLNIYSFGKLSYYSKRYTKMLFKALNLINKDSSVVKIYQIGNSEKYLDNCLKKFLNVKINFINLGYYNYSEGIKELYTNANCFIIIDNRKGAIGTKIYDYIAINRPIIYIGPKNTDLSSFVQSFENGFSCQDCESIILAIKEIENSAYLDIQQNYEKYARLYQNKLYYQLMMDLLGKENIEL